MARIIPCFCLGIAAMLAAAPMQARTIYRCERDGTSSMATAPEPGSRCVVYTVDENSTLLRGTLYQRYQDGQLVYSTRNLPGSVPALSMAPEPRPGLPEPPPEEEVVAAAKPDQRSSIAVGRPQTGVHSELFVAAARSNGIDDAWLRAIAHAESDFRADAVSPKGAQGVMQLMPAVALAYQVDNPFSAAQSIHGGARYLSVLLRHFKGDRRLAAAAYNAGVEAVARYDGVPPYAETRNYVEKVDLLFKLYEQALPSRRSPSGKQMRKKVRGR